MGLFSTGDSPHIYIDHIKTLIDFTRRDKVKEVCENLAERLNIKSVILMKILRARVVGTFNSPGIYDVLEVLGRTQTLNRLL